MSIDNTPVDPRVQIELEKLNAATDNINRYEVELDDAKCEFKKLLDESVQKIKASAHKLGNSIQTAKPYYEARLYAAQLAKEIQQAASNHEKAKSIHAAAKEMVYLAEQGLGEKSTLDTACQEMLSHAASRVNQSQIECTDTRNLLKICQLKQEVANNRVAKLQSQLKSAIKASSYNIRRKLLLMNLLAYQHDLLILPYYETRANYNGLLKSQKDKIAALESRVSESKMTYTEALKNLEQISEEIHKMRQERLASLPGQYNGTAPVIKPTLSHSSDGLSNYSNRFDSPVDEFLDFPPKLSMKSSPVRQKCFEKLDCPHLLRDFEHHYSYASSSDRGKSSDDSETLFSPCRDACTSAVSHDDIEQWTEIRLSNSESTSSSYSQHSNAVIDDHTPSNGSDTSSSGENRKVTCTTAFLLDQSDPSPGCGENGSDKKRADGISTWISRSSSFKSTGRRQSLDILIDAGDRFKDVFTSGFQKVGKSLERRNSESEVSHDNTEFFLFSRSEKDTLSDEQVENLLLNDEGCYVLKNVNDISTNK